MSVLLTSSKKAMQAKLLAKKLKMKAAAKAKRIEEARRVAAEPPLSSSSTVVWYWTQDTIPTSLFYNMDKNEVWCNGYILETTETFEDGLPAGGVISFGIYLSELDTMHEGRICRMLADGENPQGYMYVLYVNGCMIPEHLASGVSAVVTTGRSSRAPSAPIQEEAPPSYDDIIGEDDDDLPGAFDSMKLKKDN